MTPENIDGPLNTMAGGVDAAARRAYERFLELLGQGVPPREAMETVRLGFEAQYYAALSAAFEKVLAERWPEVRLRAYSVGEVTLSQALYANWKQTEGLVSGLVERHARGVQQARDLALELYTGYGLRGGEVLNWSRKQILLLPQELRELVRAPDVRDAFKVVMGRARATTLRTAALQSAYLQAFDQALAGAAQDRIDKLLEVAMQEKLRYFGNRIAQTELARAHAVERGQELLEDDTITVVQWRLSGNHPRADICDLMAKVDRYGLGPGCFPKALAPRPIAHPFCRCRLRSRPDLDAADARERSGAELSYLEGLEDWQAARLVGSRAKLERVKGGEAARDVWNDAKIDRHQIPLLGQAGRGGPPAPPVVPPAPPVVPPAPPVAPPAPPVAPPPQVSPWAPRLPDPYGVMGTQKADWHAAAWPVADNLTVRVAAKYQGRLAGLTNATAQPADAWYQRASSTIAMGAGLTTKSARDLGTWRHEFGHFLDHQIGKEFSGLSYRYRSSSADFTDAMEADAKTMLTRAKIGLRTTPKLAAARVSYLDSYRALDELMALDSTAAREAYLEAAAKKQGFTLEELRDGLAEQTNATLGTTNAGQARLARILKALENGDPQEFLRNVVEFDSAELGLIRGSELDANWRKGNMPSFSDLFGAATSNRMMPHGRGYYGHRDDYYAGSTKQFSPNFGARQTEVFANLTSISGQGDTVLWRITKRLAPNMTKIFEEILRDAIARP